MNTSVLFTFELKPGMITASDIYSNTGQLLVLANTILDNTIIEKLKLYNVATISIIEDPNYTVKKQEEPPTYSQKIKSSAEFVEFKSNYLDSIDDFQNTINDIVMRNEPIEPSKLMAETATLFDSGSSSIHIFDMLHNMREFDDSTFAHCVNVALIASVFGKWLNMSPEDISILSVAGLLHDIGKLTTPEQILTKPGKLTAEEYVIMKNHARGGYEFLKNQNLDQRIKEACLFHHERCDGSGYPLGLHGDRIPLFAKIISICDVYDAMTAKRVYRGPLCPFQVIKLFEDEGFSKYEPKLIITFLENVVSTYINNTVLLSDGRTAEVLLINSNALSKPMVKTGNDFIDLSRCPDLTIEAIL